MADAAEEVKRRDLRNYLRITNLSEEVMITVERLPTVYDRTELKKIIDTDFEEFTK